MLGRHRAINRKPIIPIAFDADIPPALIMVARGVRIIVRQTGDLEARAHIHTHPALDGGGIPGLHDAGRHRDDDIGQRVVSDLVGNP